MQTDFSIVLSNRAHSVFSGYEITEIESYNELIEFYQFCLEKHPKHRPLLVIDDIGQALYTSGHTLSKWRVDEPTLRPKKYFKSLKRKRYFKSLHACLKVDLKKVDLEHLNKRIFRFDTEELNLLNILDEPMHMIPKGKALCFLVPTTDNKLAFLGMPQGYSGLSAAEVFTYIVFIEKNIDVKFVGLGAQLLYFISKEPMTEEFTDKLIEIIRPFHYDMAGEQEQFAQTMVGKSNMIIPYRARSLPITALARKLPKNIAR